MDILPVVMDDSFNRLAVIDDYSSLIWTSRYYTTGDFEICVEASEKNSDLFRQDYYIVRDDDENVGIIEKIRIQRNEDGRELFIVSGRFLQGILARRIIGAQTQLSGYVHDCINTLLNDNIISPYIVDRQINNFVLGTYAFTDTMEAQYTGKNLLETISEICQTYGMGFKVTLNSTNDFVFTLYKGTDRTYDQSVNPWVIFSDKYDNLLSNEYIEDYENMATAVLVAGEGEGANRRTLWVSDGSAGLGRHEMYKDQRQIQSNNGEISDADYNAMLEESGEESLTRYTTAFDGEVYFDNIQYKTDIQLGDLCVIENTRWGIRVNSRLVEVIESVDESGDYQIIPTFGL